MKARPQHPSGFTLIEVMIVIALVAVVVSLAGPRFSEYILMQRLRSVQSQLLTDLAYARSEAISRGTYVQFRVQNDVTQTCYIIFSRTDSSASNPCSCLQSAGLRCGSNATEVKTVALPRTEQVQVATRAGLPDMLTIDPRTGGSNMSVGTERLNIDPFEVETLIDSRRRFRTSMTPEGRLQVCSPDVTAVGGTAC